MHHSTKRVNPPCFSQTHRTRRLTPSRTLFPMSRSTPATPVPTARNFGIRAARWRLLDEWRTSGRSYAEIADALRLPVETVRDLHRLGPLSR